MPAKKTPLDVDAILYDMSRDMADLNVRLSLIEDRLTSLGKIITIGLSVLGTLCSVAFLIMRIF